MVSWIDTNRRIMGFLGSIFGAILFGSWLCSICNVGYSFQGDVGRISGIGLSYHINLWYKIPGDLVFDKDS